MKTKYTIRIQNLTSGEIFCENEFETREEASEFMQSYPNVDNVIYRVVEINGTELN